MPLNWGQGQGGNTTQPTTDNNFTVPQSGPSAVSSGQYVNKSQMDAGDAAVLARVPAPSLVTTFAHVAGDRRTWTDGLQYTCAVGGALVGETPVTHPAKWVQFDVGKTTVDAIDTRLIAVEGGGAASLPVTTQSNTVPGGLVLNQRILVGPAGVGFFSGFNNQVATVTNPAVPSFTFAAPVLGRALFVTDATISDGFGVSLTYNGTVWEATAASFITALNSTDPNAGLAANQAPLILAKIDAPVLDVLIAHTVGQRRTHTDGQIYTCAVGGAAIGETPTTHPAKWALLEQASVTTIKAAYDRTLPVISATVAAQPASPVAGDRYILPAAATGALWATFPVGSVVQFGTTWVATAPVAGDRVHVRDVKFDLVRSTTTWERDGAQLDKVSMGSLATVTPDAANHFQPLFDAAGNPAGKAALVSIVSGGAIPAAEYGSLTLPSAYLYPGPANTWTDTGLAASITSAGPWRIIGQLKAVHKQESGDVVFALFDDTISTTTPLAGSEVEPGYIAGTNNANDLVQTTGTLLFDYSASGVKTLKLKMKCQNYVAASAALQSDANGRSRLAWEKIGSYTPIQSAIVLETNEAQLSTSAMTVSTTDIDLTGCTTPILAAGKWRIEGFFSGTDTSNSNIYGWIADQANSIMPNSSLTISNDGSAASHGASAYISIDVVSDGSKSYKLRGRGSASATMANTDHTNSSNNGSTTKIRWTKIAANVPLSNSSESVVTVSDNGTAVNTTISSTAYVDLPNALLTIPTAGEWETSFTAHVSNNTAGNGAWLAITTMTGTVIAESRLWAAAANTPGPLTVKTDPIILPGATQYKVMWKMEGAGSIIIQNANTSGFLRPRFTTRKTGGFATIPGAVAETSGSSSLLSNQATAANTTSVDTALSFVAPEAGTYEVEYEGTVSNAAVGGSTVTYITDANNNIQSESRRRSFSSTANAEVTAVGSCRMVLAVGDVAKLRIESGGANVATLYGAATQGFARFKWRKVTNYGAVAVRDPEIGYWRLTAGITAVGGANLQGAWAAEAGFINTVQQVTLGGLPVFRLKAGRWYNLELYPYTTGVNAGAYDFWEWRTVGQVILPATATGGSAYASAAGGREEMGAVVKGWVRPTIDTDVTIYCLNVSGGTLAAEGSSRSTSIFINEMPSKILA